MSPRILFLMPNFGVGGAERSVLLIAAFAHHAGFQPIVASVSSPRRPEKETVLGDLRSLGIPVHDLAIVGRADKSPIALWRAAVALRRLCRQLQIDLVDSCLFEADIVARMALLGTRVRHVTHLVSATYSPEARMAVSNRVMWRFKAVRAIDRLSGRLTTAFVSISEAVAQSAHRELSIPPRRMRVIPRGVRLDEFTAQPPRRDHAKPLRVLSVGRLVPQKDHRTAIDAAALVQARGTQVSYDIVGEGPLRAELEARVRSNDAEEFVHLHEPARDIAGEHARHDVFCFPSLVEGLGNALIEAMACARPVVVSDIPVLREVAGEHGVYFPPGDAKALADRLADIATWPTERLQQVGLALRARAEAEYAAPLQAERLGALYRELLGR